jgi:hypothetical protein
LEVLRQFGRKKFSVLVKQGVPEDECHLFLQEVQAVRTLLREILRQEREILEKATASFANEGSR